MNSDNLAVGMALGGTPLMVFAGQAAMTHRMELIGDLDSLRQTKARLTPIASRPIQEVLFGEAPPDVLDTRRAIQELSATDSAIALGERRLAKSWRNTGILAGVALLGAAGFAAGMTMINSKS